jgi:hypothetical protein
MAKRLCPGLICAIAMSRVVASLLYGVRHGFLYLRAHFAAVGRCGDGRLLYSGTARNQSRSGHRDKVFVSHLPS